MKFPISAKTHRNNLIKRLNHAILKFPNVPLGEPSKLLYKASQFDEDEEIKVLYERLLKKSTEYDDQLSQKILDALDSEALSEIESFKKELGGKISFSTLCAKATMITLNRLSEYTEEELKSWRKVFPDSVMKEIRKRMALTEILEAARHFRKKYKEAIYEKGAHQLFVEGETDKRYIEKAAELLGKKELLDKFEIIDAGGSGGLKKLYEAQKKFAELLRWKIVLLYDCDTERGTANKGKIYVRTNARVASNPVQKGIENLFERALIERANAIKPAFIDITPAITKTVRGQQISLPEVWEVNEAEKDNLCNWIVQNGTREDFEKFNLIFDMLTEINKAS